MPSLVRDGALFSQDYHIDEVRALLDNNMVCEELHQEIPKIVERYRNLAVFRYN